MSQPTKADYQKPNETVMEQKELLAIAMKEVQYLWRDLDTITQAAQSYQDAVVQLQRKLDVVEARLEERKEHRSQIDHRRLTMLGVLLGATLTFLANLVLLVLRR